jgi:hypothetical protein
MHLLSDFPTSTYHAAIYGNFIGSKVTNGYIPLPSGWLIQFGLASSPGGDMYVNFPIAFPNACFVVLPTDVGADRAPYGGYATSLSQWYWDCPIGAHTCSFITIGY